MRLEVGELQHHRAGAGFGPERPAVGPRRLEVGSSTVEDGELFSIHCDPEGRSGPSRIRTVWGLREQLHSQTRLARPAVGRGLHRTLGRDVASHEDRDRLGHDRRGGDRRGSGHGDRGGGRRGGQGDDRRGGGGLEPSDLGTQAQHLGVVAAVTDRRQAVVVATAGLGQLVEAGFGLGLLHAGAGLDLLVEIRGIGGDGGEGEQESREGGDMADLHGVYLGKKGWEAGHEH